MSAHFNLIIAGGVVVAGVCLYLTPIQLFNKASKYLRARPTLNKNFQRLTYAVTAYEILTHSLSAAKYLGFDAKFIPGGTRDDQSVTEFTAHNALDIANLVAMMICTAKECNTLPYHILLAFHISSNVLAIAVPTFFQRQVIMGEQSPLYFSIFKTLFVSTDSVMRGCALGRYIFGTE